MVASVRGARQVTFAIIATSLTLVAVFVPISFLEGDVGRLFGEFGFVMASAVLISTFVALTACPALASRILANGMPVERPVGSADAASVANRWRPPDQSLPRLLDKVLDVPVGIIAIALAVVGVSYLGYHELQRELTPREDRGVLFIPLTTPQGSTLAHTDAETRKVEAVIAPGMEEAASTRFIPSSAAGSAPTEPSSCCGWTLGRARQRSERCSRAGGRAVSELIGARGFPVVPAGLGMRGSSSPLRVVVGGPEFDSVKEWANALKERAEQNPGLRNVEIDFEENQPQLTAGDQPGQGRRSGHQRGDHRLDAADHARLAGSHHLHRSRAGVLGHSAGPGQATGARPTMCPTSSFAPATARRWCRCRRW
jgi:multidrug efflux pump